MNETKESCVMKTDFQTQFPINLFLPPLYTKNKQKNYDSSPSNILQNSPTFFLR